MWVTLTEGACDPAKKRVVSYFLIRFSPSQEYSRGTTATTSTPTYSHQLLQSKKIPDEYLTTESSTPVSESREVEKVGNVLAGFNYNDLEHEGSASSRVDFPSVQVIYSINQIKSL